MIIARTPYRISFFGGGTDYPAWYRQEGGAVLSTTIDKYCYLSCRYLPPFFTIRHRIVWSHIETVSCISEILHPAVREGLRMLGFDDALGLEIHHQGDLPARAGMGSSSAFAVGLINALMGLRGETIDKRELAARAIDLEQEVLRENVGCQDQVAATFGGFNTIAFDRDGEFHVEPVVLAPERLAELQARLMLVYSGASRLGSDIAGALVGKLHAKKVEMRRMREMVDEGVAVLRHGDLDCFGRLLDEGWRLKRSLSEGVTNPAIDEIYQKSRVAGALGGKLLGAGGSGFMLFYVPPDRQAAVCTALRHLLFVPFQFEREGSSLIYSASHVPVASGVQAQAAAEYQR